ncbi:MAG: helicase, partial [Candidatus Staskawiczbacteria bacterium]|nr:helicase [Candidatus Staskawiczbacteria bacterium]
MKQNEALDILKMGQNVFLTGSPGSGKTFLLNQYIEYLKQHQKNVAVTASTGIAATHMNGITIHSWSGLGIKETITDPEIRRLMTRKYLLKRIRAARVLIIDEVSMLKATQFDALDKICQYFKTSFLPFGGMQVVLSGDFFQLPPI